MVQYRCKDKEDIEKYKEAEEISSICKKFNALFIINDRIDIALSVNADGVHLGQQDLPSHVARELMGNEMILGRSTHSEDEIRRAEDEGVE